MSITDHTNENVRPIRRIPREAIPPMDEDLRRLCLSLFHLLQRRHPADFKRMVAEMESKRAA